MAIQNDFTIYPATKVIRHTSGTTVYSAVAFYSWLMNTFDEPGYLTYQTPISFNTPTSFTMQNGWYLDNGDSSNILQYLTGGGIDTTGYATIADPVYMLDLDTETAAFVSGDKDKNLLDDGVAVGPILGFYANYPTASTARVWVRDTRATPATIADNSVITVSSGTGSYLASGTSASGDEIYHNLFTIASFPGTPDPQLYIYQNHPQTGDRTRIAEWSAFTNWDRGSIDVLIPVKIAGSAVSVVGSNTIAEVTTFVRQTGDTYTFVLSTLSQSGRTPIATETSADTVNITEGEHYLLYDGSDTGSFTAGDVISDVDLSAGVPPTWYAEVVSVTEFTNTTSGVLELRGLRGTITDNDNIYVSNVIEGVANGTPGGTYFTASAISVQLTVGLVVTGGTSGAKRILRGVNNVASDYHYVAQVNESITGSSKDVYYKDFTTGETITDTGTGSVTHQASSSTSIISDFTDVTVAHMNGTISTGSGTGTWERGELVTWTGGTAIFIDADSLTAPTTVMLGNVTAETNLNVATTVLTGASSGATLQIVGTVGLTDDNTQQFNFSLQSFSANYSVFIEGGTVYNAGRSLTDIYAYLQYYVRDGQSISDRVIYTSDGSSITQVAAEEYIKADSTYAATKQAPFGTLAGGVFFGAQGVWVQGMQSSDNNNVKLTDASGTLREPFTSITLTISNTRSGDRIAVYLENASTTLPDKDQYASHASSNVLSGTTVNCIDGVTFPNDTPTGTGGTGTVIMVDVSASEEHRYRYSSFNNTSGTGNDGQIVLTDLSANDGTSTGGDLDTLANTGETFVTNGVKIGDIVRQTTDGGWGYVTAVAETSLEMTLNSAGNAWGPTKAYEINQLVVLYTGSDTFFVPYLDTRETTGTEGAPGTETQTLTYVSDREVVIEVRNVENATRIVPFKTTGTINSNGLTQSVIRTTDTVYA